MSSKLQITPAECRLRAAECHKMGQNARRPHVRDTLAQTIVTPPKYKLAWRGTGGRVPTKSCLQSGDEVIGSAALCRLDQLGQLFAGIKHAGLHSSGRNAENLCRVVNRLLVVVHQIEGFIFIRSRNQASLEGLGALFGFRIMRTAAGREGASLPGQPDLSQALAWVCAGRGITKKPRRSGAHNQSSCAARSRLLVSFARCSW